MKQIPALMLALTLAVAVAGPTLATAAPAVPPKPAGQSSIEQRNVRNFIRFQMDVARNDFSHLDELVAPEVVADAGADPLLLLMGITPPPSPTKTRRKDFPAMTRAAFAGLENHHRAIDEIYGIGDLVVARWRIEGVVTGSLFGIPGQGRPISLHEVGFVKYDADGRMLGGWFRVDGAEVLQQLGVSVKDLKQGEAALPTAR